MLEYALRALSEPVADSSLSVQQPGTYQWTCGDSLALAPMIKTPSEQTQTRNARDEQQWSELMIAAQQGSDVSYRRLLTALAKVIEAYLRANFGYLDFIEDCVQECLLAIHQGRHTYDPARSFRPWMFTIVRHKVIDMLRQRGRRPDTHSVDAEVAELALEHYADTSRADELSTQDEVFGELAPLYREALVLTKVVGLSLREAAGKLQISEAAMKVRVHRALRALKEQLEQYE